VKGWGDSASAICVCGKNTGNYTQYCLGVVYLLYMFYYVLCELLISCLVFIVLVVLCVLLSTNV